MSDPVAPDLLLLGGRLAATEPLPDLDADSVVVAGGRVTALLPASRARGLAGPETRVLELDGRICAPGLIDARVYPLSASLLQAGCDLRAAPTAAAGLDLIAHHASRHPDRPWLVGGGWTPADGCLGAADLDRVVGPRPAYVAGLDLCSAWLSTAALRELGIDTHTPDPPGGQIVRDPHGEPTGELRGTAADLVRGHLPADAPGDLEAALLDAQAQLHRAGITGWLDAHVGPYLATPDPLPAYLALAGSGDLTGAVALALAWNPSAGTDGLLARRDAAQAAGLRAERVTLDRAANEDAGLTRHLRSLGFAVTRPAAEGSGWPTAALGTAHRGGPTSDAADRAGFDPVPTLSARTSAAARELGLRGGVLASGAWADLIVLADDPVGSSWAVDLTVADGRLVFDRGRDAST